MTTQRWYDNPDATLTAASLLAVLGTSSGDSDKKATVAALASLIFADAVLTGTPTAPTAALGTNTDQIATMAAVKAAIDALVASAPGALDTLKELSDALGDDADFAGTMTAALAGKQPLATLLTNIVALTLGADKLIYATGSNTVAATDFTAFARSLVAAADAAPARAMLDAAKADVLSVRNTVSAVTSSAGAAEIDYALGDYFTLALSEDITALTFANLPGAGKGCTIMVEVTQDATARDIAWPASFTWANGSAGSLSTAADAVDVLAITTFDNGTTWRATLAKGFA